MAPGDDDNSQTELPLSVCRGGRGPRAGHGGDGGEFRGVDEVKNEFNKWCKIKVIRRC